MSIKNWLEEKKNSNLTIEEIDKNVKSLEEKYNVNIPDDLKELWLSLNGYCFQGCDMIASLTEVEKRGISSVEKETKTFKEYIEDWEIDYEVPNFIVVATIYEHGYVVYLDNIKKYVLVEDLFSNFILDGSDKKLLQFDSIFDVLIYFDYNRGNKVFEKEYKKLFQKEVKKEEEFHEQVKKMHLDKIKDLEEKVKNEKLIAINLEINDKYRETLTKEHNSLRSHIFNNYDKDGDFRIYIDLNSKEIGIKYIDKVETHNKLGIFGNRPPIITEIKHKDNYFVVKTDKYYLEPIIIFDSYLNNEEIKKLKSIFKKSILDFLKCFKNTM